VDVRAELEAELRRVQACSAASDCGQVITGSSCGCTRNLVAANGADLTRVRALLNETIDGERCISLISTCDCPAADGFACEVGRCTWNYR
jgi:hypothetical protein